MEQNLEGYKGESGHCRHKLSETT